MGVSRSNIKVALQLILVKTYFIDIQTSKELLQIDINKMVTNGIFTINDKLTQSEHELNRLQNHVMIDQTFFRVFNKPKCFSHSSLVYS